VNRSSNCSVDVKYYIRKTKEDPVLGPYDVSQINEQLKNGSIPIEAFASGDIGEPVSRLKKFRARDWTPIGVIPGIEVSKEEYHRCKDLDFQLSWPVGAAHELIGFLLILFTVLVVCFGIFSWFFGVPNPH